MTESIIVYRNPMEKAMWENEGNCMGITFVFVVSFAIMFFVIYQIIKSIGVECEKWSNWNPPAWVGWVSFIIGFLFAVFVTYKFLSL